MFMQVSKLKFEKLFSNQRENQLAQVAVLYYEKDISQKNIGEMLGLSKMTVSRLLQRAKKTNIVNTNIKLPFEFNNALGGKMEDNFDLEEAIVIKNAKGIKVSELIGSAWAFYMGINDLNNKKIGMGVGRTIGAMVDNLTPIKTKNTHIIQLMGGLTDVSSSNPFTITQEVCKKLGATGTYLTSFATVNSKNLKEEIISTCHLRDTDLSKCDMAIFGIGAFKKGTILSPDLVREGEFEELKQKEVVGDILGHCFDNKGNFVDSDLEDRLISIPLDRLRECGNNIALVGGDYEVSSIKGALRTGIINTLIIDEDIVKKIV